MSNVTMPQKKQGLVEGNLGKIGSLVGSYFGPVGSAIGGMAGEAASESGQKDIGAVKTSPAERRMTKINSKQEFATAQESLQNIDDPELRSVAEPIIQEALKRSDMEEQKKQSLRRGKLNGTGYSSI